MGNIRTPKTIYKNGFVMSFHVVNKEIHYIIYKWNEDGTNRGSVAGGKLEDKNPQQIIDLTIQSFTNVEVIEN